MSGLQGNDSLDGGAGNDVLRGNEGNDKLDGGEDTDTMAGGQGDDEYWVDDAGDAVAENLGEGYDTVNSYLAEYNLAANVENLRLMGAAHIGRGNGLNNWIWGTAGNNRIDGFGGADAMDGGLGDDEYWVDNAGDWVIENPGAGYDTVNSSLLEYNLAANVEDLRMHALGNPIGRGNGLNNRIWGTAGNNRIDGLAGADAMDGGLGDDEYWVDNAGDWVIENPGGGYDTVNSSLLEYNLAANVEDLRMHALGNPIGRGNGLNNRIWGTAGNNRIDGLAGADAMDGGLGDDEYWVDNAGDWVIEKSWRRL